MKIFLTTISLLLSCTALAIAATSDTEPDYGRSMCIEVLIELEEAERHGILEREHVVDIYSDCVRRHGNAS